MTEQKPRETGRRPARRPSRHPAETDAAGYAVLALLADAGGSGHGYDIARQFGDGQPLGEILRLETGMVYHHLKKLERRGWATATTEPQGNRAPRQPHTITAAGRDALALWLAEPVGRTREIRLEFLVKLYFARRLEPERVADLITRQRTVLTEAVARLSGEMEQLSGHDEDAAFVRDVLALRVGQTGAAIAWLDGLT